MSVSLRMYSWTTSHCARPSIGSGRAYRRPQSVTIYGYGYTSGGVTPPRACRRIISRVALPRALVDLRCPLRVDERDPRRDLGHLVASLDRPRHLLDAGAPRDLSRRGRRGPDLCVAGVADHIRTIRERSRGRRPLLGLPRAARRVGLHLGRDRDADVGAVR